MEDRFCAKAKIVKNLILHSGAWLIPALLLFLAACSGPEPVHFVISGGRIIDGSGGSPAEGGIAVRDGVIVAVGDVSGYLGEETIDAGGLVIAPGFIDVHNHTGRAIADPERRFNEGFLRQGVTTIVEGPDGGLGPSRIAELVEAYRRNGVGTNVAFYVGHNAIRNQVMGENQKRAPTAEQLEEMKELVRQGMEMGAVGLSTGLMYEPGMFSETGEVIALARVVAPFGGIYDSHVRNPVHEFLESDREVIQIAEGAGIPGKIGHIKGVGLHNEGVIREIIRLVEDARRRGVEIVSDQYPYDGAATASLSEIIVWPPDLPEAAKLDELLNHPPASPGAALAELKILLANARLYPVLKQASEQGVAGGFAWLKATGYNAMRITNSEDHPQLVGKYLSEIAEEEGQEPFRSVVELILNSEHPVFITLGAIKEPDVEEIMRQPWNMIASDGDYADGSERSGGHPRSAGTFPRFLGHYVREVGLLTLPEAVRKITSLPAEFLSLAGRGRLQTGYAADIVVFDPDKIRDRSDWTHPHRFAEGVQHLLVNGVLVLREGELTGEAPGEFLKKEPAP